MPKSEIKIPPFTRSSIQSFKMKTSNNKTPMQTARAKILKKRNTHTRILSSKHLNRKNLNKMMKNNHCHQSCKKKKPKTSSNRLYWNKRIWCKMKIKKTIYLQLRENWKRKSSKKISQMTNLQPNSNHRLRSWPRKYGMKMTSSTKLMFSSKITSLVKNGSANILMVLKLLKSSIQLIKKMKKEAYKWTNTRQSTTSGMKNLMGIRSFNIQEKLENQWESCPNQESRKERKSKKEKKRNKNNSEKKLKRKSNNWRVIFWQSFNKNSNKIRTIKMVNRWTNKTTVSMTGFSVTIAAKPFNKKKLITNVNSVKITCFAKTVLILLFTSIPCINLMFLLDLELLNKA